MMWVQENTLIPVYHSGKFSKENLDHKELRSLPKKRDMNFSCNRAHIFPRPEKAGFQGNHSDIIFPK